MRLTFCVACGLRDADALEHHHIVPRSAGGGDEDSNLITLCHACHGRMHGYERVNTRRLTMAGLAAAKARGTTFGNRKNSSEALAKDRKVLSDDADAFARNVLPMIQNL